MNDLFARISNPFLPSTLFTPHKMNQSPSCRRESLEDTPTSKSWHLFSPDLLRGLMSPRYHIHTLYLFTCNNVIDVILPGLLFASLSASVASRFSMGADQPLALILASIPKMLLWSWTNLLVFNLSNQRSEASIKEDMVNKPWRPLPSGRLTSADATRLFNCVRPTVLVVSFWVGGLVPCILIMCLSYCYDDRGAASNPLIKNMINGMGIGCYFAGPFEVITGRSILSGKGDAAIWVLMIMGAIATTSHAQDLRDQEGDRAAGRETLPNMVGDMNARLLAVVGIIGWTCIAASYWGVGWTKGGISGIAGAIMAGNMLRDRTRKGDILTWKFFPLWMFGLFLMPVWAE